MFYLYAGSRAEEVQEYLFVEVEVMDLDSTPAETGCVHREREISVSCCSVHGQIRNEEKQKKIDL